MYFRLPLLLTIAGLLATTAPAQTSNAFDSAVQAAQIVKNDSVRLRTLLTVTDKIKDLSARQNLKLNSLILADAITLKIDSTTIDAYLEIGHSNMLLSNYTQALDSYLSVLKIAEKNGDHESEAKAYEEIGWIYKMTGEINKTPADLDKAELYMNKGLQITQEHGLAALEINMLSDLAVIYDLRKMHTEAIETYKHAIAKVDKQSPRKLITLYMNLGICYKNNGEFDSAMAVYRKAVTIADSPGLEMYKLFLTDNMANLYYEMGQYAVSESMAKNAIDRSFVNDVVAIRVDMYGLLKKLYEKEAKYKEAFAYAENLTVIKDSMFNSEKSAQLKDMQEKYETDIKDKQIITQTEQLKQNRKLNLILGGGGIILLAIIVFVYANLRKTARLNKVVSIQRDELAKQSSELSVMMKELHHRVKNNLQIVSSLLNLQSLRVSDEEALHAVTESRQRVQAMSLIHQRLYKADDITGVNMKDYIKDLVDYLATAYGFGPDNITTTLDMDAEWLDVDKALPIGLILNELLTNAFKYAFEGVVHPNLYIRFGRSGQQLMLTVKDNGRGIDPAKWNNNQDASFGKQLVKALCSQLRAKEKLEVEGGTSFTFVIPAA